MKMKAVFHLLCIWPIKWKDCLILAKFSFNIWVWSFTVLLKVGSLSYILSNFRYLPSYIEIQKLHSCHGKQICATLKTGCAFTWRIVSLDRYNTTLLHCNQWSLWGDGDTPPLIHCNQWSLWGDGDTLHLIHCNQWSLWGDGDTPP